MPTATVEVKFVNQPDKNPAFGSIKTADGTYYGVPKFMLADFQQGGVYDIEYKTREFKGKEYHSISERPTPTTQTASATGKVMKEVTKARTSEIEAEQMWVCHLLGAALRQGSLTIAMTDLVEAGKICREARTEIFKSTKAKDPGVDDEVPY